MWAQDPSRFIFPFPVPQEASEGSQTGGTKSAGRLVLGQGSSGLPGKPREPQEQSQAGGQPQLEGWGNGKWWLGVGRLWL